MCFNEIFDFSPIPDRMFINGENNAMGRPSFLLSMLVILLRMPSIGFSQNPVFKVIEECCVRHGNVKEKCGKTTSEVEILVNQTKNFFGIMKLLDTLAKIYNMVSYCFVTNRQ